MTEPSPFLLRAYAARFQLEQATQDMNEILEEFEAVLRERFPANSASVRIPLVGYDLLWEPRQACGLNVIFGADSWQPVRSVSREVRAQALVVLEALWRVLVEKE